MQGDPSPAPRRRGRPPSFDRDAATSAALGALWSKGYEATTVEDLTRATGLAPSSLYAAFGSKHGVLSAALTRYDRDRDALLAPLEHGHAGVADLLAFLDAVRRSLAEPGTPGCFMVNTATEVAPRDPLIAEQTNRYRTRVRQGITAALRRAAELGETQPGGELDRARIVQACVYGALVAARSGAAPDATAALDALERQVETWPDKGPGQGDSAQ